MTEYHALVENLDYAGPDQGIDFTGGPGRIKAPVDMQITRVDLHSGWPGGHIIVGRVLRPHWHNHGGHGYGYFIYTAEAIVPAPGLGVNDKVEAGEVYAHLHSAYPGCEIGWAQNSYGAAFGSIHDGKPGGPAPVHGLAFRDFIIELGHKRPGQ